MAPPRRRKPENEDLPPNVYPNRVGNVVYYYFEFPDNHAREQLGTDKVAAIKTGKALNAALGHISRKPRQIGITVAQAAREWLPRRQERVGSDSAKKRARQAMENISLHFGRRGLRDLTTRDISDYLEKIPLSYRSKERNEFIRLFDFALARGYLPHDYGNPAKVTEYQGAPRAQRMRLGYADYQRIHAAAPPWLKTLMDLMLHTTLRPGDTLRLRFDQFYDGALHTQVRKTGKYLRIELDTQEQAIIKRARQSGIASPYIVHRMPERKGKRMAAEKTHPTQVTIDQASREFSRIRDELGICADVPPKQRASLYEVRSTGAWLYGQSGRDRKEVKELMAHTSEQMTAHYQDDRRVNFVTVKAGLRLA